MNQPMVDLLTRVRARLERPECWTQGYLARTAEAPTHLYDPRADSWCLVGAIKAEGTDPLIKETFNLLERLARTTSLPLWNDRRSRSHRSVLNLLDRALAEARS